MTLHPLEMLKQNSEEQEKSFYRQKIENIIKELPKYLIRPSWYSITKMINPQHTNACTKLYEITEEEVSNRTQKLETQKSNLENQVSAKDAALDKQRGEINELETTNSGLRTDLGKAFDRYEGLKKGVLFGILNTISFKELGAYIREYRRNKKIKESLGELEKTDEEISEKLGKGLKKENSTEPKSQ